jgi:hypothetical protein
LKTPPRTGCHTQLVGEAWKNAQRESGNDFVVVCRDNNERIAAELHGDGLRRRIGEVVPEDAEGSGINAGDGGIELRYGGSDVESRLRLRNGRGEQKCHGHAQPPAPARALLAHDL